MITRWFLEVGIPVIGIILCIFGVSFHQKWGMFKRPSPLTPYQEICAIKDRLYRDFVRLEELQGRATASDNVQRILLDTSLWKATR